MPRFATDRLNRPSVGAPLPDPALKSLPLATVAAVHGGQRLAAVDGEAERRGLRPGMPLADARAVVPDVRIVPIDPDADRAMLEKLCAACERYTPWAAIDPQGARPNKSSHAPTGDGAGLWLDVTGCTHLFGGEEALLADIAARFARAGFRTRAALAATPGAAWALARYGGTDQFRAPPGEERALLKALPVAALRLDAQLVEGLDRMGLRQIGDLVHLARAPLARRFGRVVLDRIDQLFGDLEEPISPRQAPPVHVVRRVFAEPIGKVEDIELALAELLPTLCADLESHGQGVRTLDYVLHRVDNSREVVEVGTSRPVRDAGHLARLFREKLAEVDPGFGVEVVVLAARVVAPLTPAQATLDAEADTDSLEHTGAARLVDRLTNRLGHTNVTRLTAVESHLPERACHERPAMTNKPNKMSWNQPDRRPQRPIKLLGQPLPIDVLASVPDGPPASFQWRRQSHRVVNAEGPERIAPEWWVNEGRQLSRDVRDYYRIEDEDGRRYWVYREGLFLPGFLPRWYLHGFFA
ncbi:MAG: imuB [Rhizobiaceae bacterium]|nr:imuB [Rhizobiaceae bacterium]